ncbi:MAG: DMT family transporter [Promethearchaeota archaeon]
MEEENTIRGYIIIIGAVFTWSFSEVIVKMLQGTMGALSLSFFRFFIGGLFLLLLLLLKKDLKGIWIMLKNNLGLFLISSSFALGISNIIYFIGVQNTQANIASTLYTSYPIWITIYSIFILNERTNLKLKFIGIIIGLLGVAILMTNLNFGALFSTEYLFGNVLVLLGSIIWGLYSVLGKKIQLNHEDIENHAIKFSMLSFFLACIPIFCILIFTPEYKTFMDYPLESWFWILFMGVISTGIGIYLLFYGIRYIEVSRGISLAFLKPIFATILAYFLLNEEPTLILFISIGLVILSIILINRNIIIEDDFMPVETSYR